MTPGFYKYLQMMLSGRLSSSSKKLKKNKKIKIKEINVQFFFSHNKIRFFHVDLASGMSDESEKCGWIIWKKNKKFGEAKPISPAPTFH